MRSPFGGFGIAWVENALGDAGAEDRAGIVRTIGLFDLACVLGDKQRFDTGDVHDLRHAAHPYEFIEDKKDRSDFASEPFVMAARDGEILPLDAQDHDRPLVIRTAGMTALTSPTTYARREGSVTLITPASDCP